MANEEGKQTEAEKPAKAADQVPPVLEAAPTPKAPAPKAEAPEPARVAPAAAAPVAPAAAAPAARVAETEAPPVAPTPAAGARKAKAGAQAGHIYGLGRRKTSVARILMRPGNGGWKVNGRTLEDYFPRSTLRQTLLRPLVLTETQGDYDIQVRVAGGGSRGQADAVRLGLARALLKVDEGFRRQLRAEDLLTRDAREVERKKPGRPKARKRFQFSKR